MRNLQSFRKSRRPRRAPGVGFDASRPLEPGAAEPMIEVGRKFTPTATNIQTPGRVAVQLADEAGNPDGFRREVFDARD